MYLGTTRYGGALVVVSVSEMYHQGNQQAPSSNEERPNYVGVGKVAGALGDSRQSVTWFFSVVTWFYRINKLISYFWFGR